ncbi:MAG TPA: hypothetical protein VMA36_21145 [Candidatus Limnocylindria bacterium]|jgi:hypothetical protein|nr:hypothetical protein [Candidatus Limnocylindria bacterium]
MDGSIDEYTMMKRSDHEPMPSLMLWPLGFACCCHDGSGVPEVTVAELIAELRALAPNVVACVMDDQGVPHEITWIRYRADLNMVAIESGCMVGGK